jgi:hypothetical protein
MIPAMPIGVVYQGVGATGIGVGIVGGFGWLTPAAAPCVIPVTNDCHHGVELVDGRSQVSSELL